MNKTALFLLAVLPSTVFSKTYMHSMTGEMLVRNFLGPPGQSGEMLKGDDYLQHETARGYLDGIKDATEGVVWCYTGRLKPHELNYDLVESIRKLPTADQQNVAAPLVLVALRQKYPCAKPSRRKP